MIDVLAIGAHPDDIEMRVGATLCALRRQGRQFAFLHLTRGEAGTRGTPDTRRDEALAAARILGAQETTILDLGDGRLHDSDEARAAVIREIRRLRPAILMVPHFADEHPDHAAAGRICRAARYLAGISRATADVAEAFRPNSLWHYPGHEVPTPSCVVMVTEEDVEVKMRAIRSYKSQFYDPASAEPETRISQKTYLDELVARMRFFGSVIGASYGEPFVMAGPVAIPNVTALLP